MNYLVQKLINDEPIARLEAVVLCEKHLSDSYVTRVQSADECEQCQQESRQAEAEWRDRQSWLVEYVTDGKPPIYIGGPMSLGGTIDPTLNFQSFYRMEGLLRTIAAPVLNPARCEHTDREYAWYMERTMRMLLDGKVCVFLLGWEKSRGAYVEHHVADVTGRKIYYEL